MKRENKLFWIILLTILVTPCTLLGGNIIKGSVICDGKGVQNILVSDGYEFAITDKKGAFKMETHPSATTIHITIPSGYEAVTKGSIPQFHYKLDGRDSYNFQIKKGANDYNHTFILTTDIQVATKEDCKWYGEIAKDIKEYTSTIEGTLFGIDLGDIVADRPELYDDYLMITDSLRFPIYRTIGNHDMNYYGHYFETSYSRFEEKFAPNRYSMNKGNVHYIFVDNCFYVGRDYFYIGYYTKECFDWIVKDLSYVPEGSTVIICQHIPGRLSDIPTQFKYNSQTLQEQTANFGELCEVLGKYNVTILSGHSHLNNNFEHTEGIFEHNVSAVCGGWWSGDIALDGTPLGYLVVNVSGDQLQWVYKSYRHSEDYQFRAYRLGEDRNMKDYITANVWNWDKGWKVELIEDETTITPMEQYTGYDEDALVVYTGVARQRYSWIYPVQTSHLFRAKPQNSNAHLKVRVTDRFGKVYEKEL